MVTIESFCDDDTAGGSAQPGEDQQRTLNKAMKRAEKARRELIEAIHQATTFEDVNMSSSSDSDNEGTGDGKCTKEGRLRHQHSHGPHHHGPHHHEHHGPHGVQHPRHPMTGRHMMSFGKFPGMMRHGVGRRPHHPPHLHLHPHPHHHRHRHHHHMGHSFGAHGSHCGRGHHGHRHGHGHGSAMRAVSAFGMGHASGHRVRA